MKNLPKEILIFFQRQNFVIVSTVGEDGVPHSACKGIVKITEQGKIYLIDLYKAVTYKNLKSNSRISITAVDEHKFIGYCLKGKAAIVDKANITAEIITAWENRITGRITHRVLRNMSGEKGHDLHPESQLPIPQYLIVVEAEDIVDLTPHPLR